MTQLKLSMEELFDGYFSAYLDGRIKDNDVLAEIDYNGLGSIELVDGELVVTAND